MNNFYCAAPWRGLHINAKGDVKTCCAGNPNMLNNLNSQKIEEILDGAKLKEIRESLRQGIPHQQYCGGCIQREEQGGDSERSWHNTVNESFDYTNAGANYQFPAIIDVRWNTTCNLSCNYCGSNDSSKWASLQKISVSSDTRHYYTEVCDFIEKHYDQVKEVAMVGGEPLLLPENERLLDVIPPDCIVTLITNLSNPLENNRIFKKLSQRSRVGWSISFDNIGDRFEYVRHGASWKLMLHNLDLVQDLMKNNGHWGGIHAVYNLYNATRLQEFKRFADERGLSIRWQNIGHAVLNQRIYGKEIAGLVLQEAQTVLDTCKVDDQEKELFNSMITHCKTQTQSDIHALNKLKIFVDEIENKYHPDKVGEFARLWPEFGELLWPQNQH